LRDLRGVETDLGDVEADLEDVEADLGDIETDLGVVEADLGDVEAEFCLMCERLLVHSMLHIIRCSLKPCNVFMINKMNVKIIMSCYIYAMLKFLLQLL